MDFMRLVRTLGVVCLILSCASCGGGGGGAPSDPNVPDPPPGSSPPPNPGTPPSTPPGPAPTFSVSNTTFDFFSPHANVTPASQRIPISFDGSVGGGFTFLANVADGLIVSVPVNYVSVAGQRPVVDASVVPTPAQRLLPGTSSTTVSLVACLDDSSTCTTGQLPGSPQTINVTYTRRSEIQGDVVAPRVVTAGESATVVLHGRGLANATQVTFGGVAGTDLKVSELNGDVELRVSHPALAAGTYPILVNAGAIPFSASLVVVTPPRYAATQLTYPSTPQLIGGVAYDAQRQAFYVAARYADAQTNTLFKFQVSGGVWQAPVSLSVPSLQDVALSPDGATVLLATDTAVVEVDAATLALGGTYAPSDELIRAGTAYIQGIAVANDGYAIVTTGGANPSNVLLYSTTTHTFLTVNSVSALPLDDADPRLYFGNAGVSANGSLVVLSQDPRTATASSGSRPFIYLYSATGVQRPSLYGFRGAAFSDKDRSQAGRSARPAVHFTDSTVLTTRVVIHGPRPVVLGADYSVRGLLPSSTRASVFNKAGTRLYAFDAPAGAQSGELRSYDVSVRLNASTEYLPVGTAVPMSPGTGAIVMATTPDGETVFIVGTSGVFVQPSPT
jgi:hypothetical protein